MPVLEKPPELDRTTATVTHVLTNTLKTGLKGALIGGLALGAAALLPAAIPALLSAGTGGFLLAGTGPSIIGSWLVTGAVAGAGIGGAIGLVSGVSGAEEAVDEQAQIAASKYTRQQQLAANQEMMQMNLERYRAAQRGGGMPIQPQHDLPMGRGAGVEIG